MPHRQSQGNPRRNTPENPGIQFFVGVPAMHARQTRPTIVPDQAPTALVFAAVAVVAAAVFVVAAMPSPVACAAGCLQFV